MFALEKIKLILESWQRIKLKIKYPKLFLFLILMETEFHQRRVEVIVMQNVLLFALWLNGC